MNSKRVSNSSHHKQAGIAFPPFDTAHVGQVNLRLKRKLLLRQPLLPTKAADILA